MHLKDQSLSDESTSDLHNNGCDNDDNADRWVIVWKTVSPYIHLVCFWHCFYRLVYYLLMRHFYANPYRLMTSSNPLASSLASHSIYLHVTLSNCAVSRRDSNLLVVDLLSQHGAYFSCRYRNNVISTYITEWLLTGLLLLLCCMNTMPMTITNLN